MAPDSLTPPVIRKLQDLLKEEKFTPNVEKQLGMTKEEAEQFVKKFEKRPPTTPVAPGREIKVQPGQDKVYDPNKKAPEFNTGAIESKKASRAGNSMIQDSISGLSEGGKSTPPPELSKKFEAYKKSLSNSKVVAPSGATPPAKR